MFEEENDSSIEQNNMGPSEPSDDMESNDDFDKNELQDEELNQFIEELCLSKAEEFHMLGYEYVTGQEVWECVSGSYDKQGVPLLHRIVNDVLTLKVTRFMNWMTMKAYKLEEL